MKAFKSWEEYKDYLTSGGQFQVNRLDLHKQTWDAAKLSDQQLILDLTLRLEETEKIINRINERFESKNNVLYLGDTHLNVLAYKSKYNKE